MRAVLPLAIAVAAGLSACVAEEDHGPFRPGGGGGTGGGSSQGGDARPIDAPADDGDGGSALTGRICVVTDLRAPDACPVVASRAGVTVSLVGSSATTTSASDGGFTLPVSASAVVLDAAAGSPTFERSIVPATVGGVVDTPVVTQAAYAAVLGSLGTVVPDGGGAVVAYVVDGASPATGVAFATIAGSSLAPFYDNGSATAWTQSGGTGAAGVALLVDVPAGSVQLDGTAPDARVARATVPVVADAITFVEIALAAPP